MVKSEGTPHFEVKRHINKINHLVSELARQEDSNVTFFRVPATSEAAGEVTYRTVEINPRRAFILEHILIELVPMPATQEYKNRVVYGMNYSLPFSEEKGIDPVFAVFVKYGERNFQTGCTGAIEREAYIASRAAEQEIFDGLSEKIEDEIGPGGILDGLMDESVDGEVQDEVEISININSSAVWEEQFQEHYKKPINE